MKLVFEDQPWLGVRRGEIITAMCNLLHPIFSKAAGSDGSSFYSKHNILQTVTDPRSIGHAARIADLFLKRFDPKQPMKDERLFQQSLEEIRNKISSDIQESHAKELLFKMTEIIEKTYKTNIYMKDRYALSLRLDPSIMGVGSPEDSTLPFGVLFIHGQRFNGYHTRFRDISRGGLRLVAPASSEQLALESSRQYDECYGLAYAQQLKNKDIPEGGSKAVCLIDTNDIATGTRDYVLRKAVKAMTDSILDLVVDTEETQETIVDYFGKKEVLYLGPDENVTPEDINWIIKQAGRRGYTTPAAFMSSKPRAGINHKEYGVTSEGVNVFLDVALQRVLGIDPRKESFTVKMTGGPDGDVGGNQINIMIREYGENAKIVGIADHSGCAEDPDGLNHEELLRLFEEELCISNFSASRLGPNGILHLCDTEEGTKARNTMHNRLKTDAFVPCGGRPNTIDVNNYEQFLLDDGTPSSKLIVEGANLFVTTEARQKLYEEAGVLIVKDSSANKGGVITSSFEICAAMLASEEQFFQNKESIVAEVLAKLRGFAKMEAELLFREAELYGESLPEVSQIISHAINSATDALSAALETLPLEDQDELLSLFHGHLPKTLAELGFDKVRERVPQQYIKNAIASTLASKMVYKEGTRFIISLPDDRLAETALGYIQQETEVIKLINTLEQTDMSTEEKSKILKLLDAGGARTALTLKQL
jgi:glutamate dehydrogenase